MNAKQIAVTLSITAISLTTANQALATHLNNFSPKNSDYSALWEEEYGENASGKFDIFHMPTQARETQRTRPDRGSEAESR